MNEVQSPNINLEMRINKVIDLLNPNSKKKEEFYRELLINEKILIEIEELITKEYLLTQKGFKKYVKKKFPKLYDSIIKRSFQFYIEKNYSEENVKKAKEIIKNNNYLNFCFKTIQKRHIRETEILLLLLFSGISSGFKNRELTLHLMAIGQSGKGKSASMHTVSKIFSEVQIINSSSAKSQFYKAQSGDMIDNGILIYDESENSKEAQSIERVYVDRSSRTPSHETLTPNSHKFIRLEINEINVVWRNSVDTPIDEENQLSNRYLIFNVDESKEQDELVFNAIIENYGYGKIEENNDLEISKIITDLIKEESYKVFIPFFKQITSDNKSNRRTIQKFLSLLWSITYFNRFQRNKIGEYLIATFEDFELSKMIWDKINQTEAMQLPNKFLKILAVLQSKEEMEIKEIASNPDISFSESKIRRLLKEMKEKGYVDYEKRFEGTNKHFWKAFQHISRVFIDFSKDKFSIEDFKLELNELKRKIGNQTFQDVKYVELIEKSNYMSLYENIIQTTISFEKLKSQIKENSQKKDINQKNKELSNSDNEISLKSYEKCSFTKSSENDDIERINMF